MPRIRRHKDRDRPRQRTKRQKDRFLGWQWEQLRAVELALRPNCAACYYHLRDPARGASVLHHIVPRSWMPAWAYEVWNLTSLCRRCHERIHAGGNVMARDIHVEQDDYNALCDGQKLQRGPVRLTFAPGICTGGEVQHILINEAILAQLLLGGTYQHGNYILDWDEGLGPQQRGEVAAKLQAQLNA